VARHPGVHVVVLDALTYAGRRENLDGVPAGRLTFVHGDIRNAEAVATAMHGCDCVLNFAAESHVDRSIEKAGEFIQTDVYGVFVLCEEARRAGIRRFVQVHGRGLRRLLEAVGERAPPRARPTPRARRAATAWTKRRMPRAAPLAQHEHAVDVGLDELARLLDAAVDVRLGREVEHAVAAMHRVATASAFRSRRARTSAGRGTPSRFSRRPA